MRASYRLRMGWGGPVGDGPSSVSDTDYGMCVCACGWVDARACGWMHKCVGEHSGMWVDAQACGSMQKLLG